ncbi:hypothetical protein Zmor_019145 [Zophobas morio]|uniref:Uncharacterized protein n=1 Tax=Zophobas morio TaxID=2755281 RepID=A0AA38M0P0_9CUCU|nr:hypothetical protein Zmor_019145 [Zophobas morio]
MLGSFADKNAKRLLERISTSKSSMEQDGGRPAIPASRFQVASVRRDISYLPVSLRSSLKILVPRLYMLMGKLFILKYRTSRVESSIPWLERYYCRPRKSEGLLT